MEKLKEKLISLGVNDEILYITKENEMFINCADKQLVKIKNGKYTFGDIGGSRFFRTLESFDTVDKCAEYIMTFVNLTNDDCNRIYRGLWGKISK